MIKRFLTLLLLTIACMSAATANDDIHIIKSGLSRLPSFTKDGKMYAYLHETADQDTRTRQFTIYNEDFEVEKEFVTISGTPNAYSYQIQERERIPVSATVYREDIRRDILTIDGISEGLTIETVHNWLNQTYGGDYWEIRTMDDGLQVIAYTSNCYNEEYFGKKYPSTICKEVDGLWYFFNLYYDVTYGPYGEWKEPELEEGISYPYTVEVKIQPIDGADDYEFELTKGIFSEDFNYVLPVYEKVEFNDEYTYGDTDWVYRKEWGYKSIMKGFKAYDSSNREVASFNIPEGYRYTSDYPSITFWRLGNKRYLSLKARSDSEYVEIIYRLDDNNNVTQVAIAPPPRSLHARQGRANSSR